MTGIGGDGGVTIRGWRACRRVSSRAASSAKRILFSAEELRSANRSPGIPRSSSASGDFAAQIVSPLPSWWSVDQRAARADRRPVRAGRARALDLARPARRARGDHLVAARRRAGERDAARGARPARLRRRGDQRSGRVVFMERRRRMRHGRRVVDGQERAARRLAPAPAAARPAHCRGPRRRRWGGASDRSRCRGRAEGCRCCCRAIPIRPPTARTGSTGFFCAADRAGPRRRPRARARAQSDRGAAAARPDEGRGAHCRAGRRRPLAPGGGRRAQGFSEWTAREALKQGVFEARDLAQTKLVKLVERLAVLAQSARSPRKGEILRPEGHRKSRELHPRRRT